MQPTIAGQTTSAPGPSAVPAAFIVGVFLLLVTVILQLATYVPGTEFGPGAVAFGLATGADACFLYIWRRGGWAARAFALLCGSAALLATFNSVWWVTATLRLWWVAMSHGR